MYLKQTGTSTVVVNNICNSIDYTGNLSAHPAIVVHPTLFEIINDTPPNDATYLDFHQATPAEQRQAYRDNAQSLIDEMQDKAVESGSTTAQGATLATIFGNVYTSIREGNIGIAIVQLGQHNNTGIELNSVDLKQIWINLATSFYNTHKI